MSDTKFMDETYDYFMDPKNLPREEDKGKPWYEARMEKRNELMKLVRLDDGEYVFREWADQFKGRTMEAIAAELRAPEDVVPLLSKWTAMVSHDEWMVEHGEDRPGDGPFVAVMEYGATGEGHRIQIIAAHAPSLAHFILYVGEKLEGYYFVISTDLYRTLEEAKSDGYFKRLVPEEAYGFFSNRCHVDVNLLYYINCS